MDKLFLYYFGDIISSLPQGTFQKFRQRIKVVEGDVTDIESLERIKDLPINTVFNCAANVKHFSSGTDIEDVNVGGVINCIRFCKASGARLIHFSTTSVAGTIKNTPENSKIILTEQNMFYGQELANQYTSSKMLAELEVMKAIIEDGLNAKIIRVGTLAARDRDGEFQANYLSNSFAGRLRSYFVLKAFPYSMMDALVRMGPIDVSSEAFLKLARTPKENCLFNAVNNNTLPLSILINVMRECGIQIDYVEDDEFTRRLEEAEKNQDKAQILQSITAYNSLHKAGLRDVAPSGDFTAQLLARMNFFWPVTSTTYIERFVNGLIGLDFFDEDFLNR